MGPVMKSPPALVVKLACSHFKGVEGMNVEASGEMGDQVRCGFGNRDGSRELEKNLGGERGEHN